MILLLNVPAGLSLSPTETLFLPTPHAGSLHCLWLALGQKNPYPELAQGVDMLGLEEGIIVTVHQAFPMDHSGIVHQNGDVTHLWARGGCGAVRAASPCGLYLERHRPGSATTSHMAFLSISLAYKWRWCHTSCV